MPNDPVRKSGSPVDADADACSPVMEEINKKADEVLLNRLAKTKEQAMEKVLREEPGLYEEYLNKS